MERHYDRPRVVEVIQARLDEKAALTLAEAAAYIGVSRRTIDNLRTSSTGRPRLKTFCIGRAVRVARVDADAYINSLRADGGR